MEGGRTELVVGPKDADEVFAVAQADDHSFCGSPAGANVQRQRPLGGSGGITHCRACPRSSRPSYCVLDQLQWIA